ncbi:MAG: 2-dehydropantoate 2-reductase [Cyclobacteriaceae bacterium]
MKITVIGGTGAMGLIFGARLAQAGHEVTLLDVNKEAIEAVNKEGARITNKEGVVETIKSLRATSDPASIKSVELAIIFTKCYWTEEALMKARSIFTSGTTVLTLQNGWGNYDVITKIVDPEKILVGVSYVSGTTLGPGHARQVGNPVAYVGKVGAVADESVKKVAEVLNGIGIKTTASDDALKEIFTKLAHNVACLAITALLKMEAHRVVDNDYTIALMDELLIETIAVAKAKGIQLDAAERRKGIHDLMRNAVGARSSMLQDVDAKRKTEIDVINGAIVRMGKEAGIPTPMNECIVRLIKGLETTF